MDLTQAAYALKLALDQKYHAAQTALAALLWNSRGVSKERSTSARYFKFAAEQGVAEESSREAISLLTGDIGMHTLLSPISTLQSNITRSAMIFRQRAPPASARVCRPATAFPSISPLLRSLLSERAIEASWMARTALIAT
jgi:TPR repeat protein